MSRRGKKRDRCPLCGKRLPFDREQVVYGTTGQGICKSCLESADLIRRTEENETPVKLFVSPPIMTPEAIVSALDQSIIGQSEAKQALAAALWKQQLRARGDPSVPRSTLLLYGPTGCGKTALVREAAKLVGLPFLSFDATTLSEAGYRGRDAQDMIHDYVHAHRGNKHLSYGVVFLDEVDKLAAQGGEYRMAYSRGTQHALLKLVEGTQVLSDGIDIDTERLLFVFGGAFSGLEKIVEKRVSPGRAIGFGAQDIPHVQCMDATTEDFIAYGMEPELMGRFTRRAHLDALSEEDLRKILLESKLSVYRRYQEFFKHRGIRLEASEKRIREWIDEAGKLGTGARGLQTVVEQSMEPLLFKLAEFIPDNSEVVWDAG